MHKITFLFAQTLKKFTLHICFLHMYLRIDILQQNLKHNLRKRQEIKKIQKLSKKKSQVWSTESSAAELNTQSMLDSCKPQMVRVVCKTRAIKNSRESNKP